jgi:hypothetical protein
MNARTLSLLIAAALSGFAACADADEIAYDGLGHWSAVEVHLDGSPVSGETIPAGQILISRDGDPWVAYCLEIEELIQDGTMTLEPLGTLARGGLAGYLISTYGTDVGSDVEGAALQSALWEAMNETAPTYDLFAGDFALPNSSAVATRANEMLASAPANPDPADYTAAVLHSDTGQDLLIFDPSVPEPGTAAILAVGFVAGLARRRRRRAAA